MTETTPFPLSNISNISTNPLIEPYTIPDYGKYILYVLLGFTFVFGIVGNILVIIIVGIVKKTMTSGDCLIISLAVADLIGSIVSPLYKFDEIYSLFWVTGDVLCHLLHPMSVVAIIASAYNLAVISIDRYRVITRPFENIHKKKRILIVIILIWVFSIGCSLIEFISATHEEVHHNNKTYTFCYPERKILGGDQNEMVYVVSYFVITYIIPVVTIVIVYRVLTMALLRNNSFRENNSAHYRSWNRNKRAVSMFKIVTAFFSILTLPYSVFIICYFYLRIYNLQIITNNYNIVSILSNSLYTLHALNGCVNPFIYCRMQKDMRDVMKKFMRKLSSMKRRRDRVTFK